MVVKLTQKSRRNPVVDQTKKSPLLTSLDKELIAVPMPKLKALEIHDGYRVEGTTRIEDLGRVAERALEHCGAKWRRIRLKAHVSEMVE